ncbi:MAG: DUF5131 family protein, partial [Pseudonocardiaceae bacterium]
MTKRPRRLAAYFGAAPYAEWSYWVGKMSRGRQIEMIQRNFDLQADVQSGDNFPLQNLWIGVSVENQETADERIPLLLQTPAAVRFLSVEPLLASMRLADGWLYDDLSGRCAKAGGVVDWVIVGGESGPGARPMHPQWVRDIHDQCVAAGVPFFFKQWGEWIQGDAIPGGDLGADMRRGVATIVEYDRE